MLKLNLEKLPFIVLPPSITRRFDNHFLRAFASLRAVTSFQESGITKANDAACGPLDTLHLDPSCCLKNLKKGVSVVSKARPGMLAHVTKGVRLRKIDLHVVGNVIPGEAVSGLGGCLHKKTLRILPITQYRQPYPIHVLQRAPRR